MSTTGPPNPDWQRADRAQRLAAGLLRRARLRRSPGVSRGQVAAALFKALAMAGPASPHGRLLVAALTPTTAARPAAQGAVRRLLCDGQVPTPAAVLGRLADHDRHDRAVVVRAPALRLAVARRLGDGPAAAELVAKHWEAHGHGPTWHELGHHLGWPYKQVGATIRALAEAGWLAPGTAPRSLRPGSQHDQAQGPAARHAR